MWQLFKQQWLNQSKYTHAYINQMKTVYLQESTGDASTRTKAQTLDANYKLRKSKREKDNK